MEIVLFNVEYDESFISQIAKLQLSFKLRKLRNFSFCWTFN